MCIRFAEQCRELDVHAPAQCHSPLQAKDNQEGQDSYSRWPPEAGASNQGEINFVNCVIPGHTKFFPGKNEIHYRAVESIQVY